MSLKRAQSRYYCLDDIRNDIFTFLQNFVPTIHHIYPCGLASRYIPITKGTSEAEGPL